MESSKAADYEKTADKAEKEIVEAAKIEREAHKAHLDYAQKNLFFVADQRLKIFNYYAILIAASITGAVSGLNGKISPYAIAVIGIISVVIAHVFEAIEIRNVRLLKLSRSALIELENNPLCPPHMRLCTKDQDAANNPEKVSHEWWDLKGKYEQWMLNKAKFTNAFRWAYTAHKLVGVGLVVAAFTPLVDPPSAPAPATGAADNSALRCSCESTRSTELLPEKKKKRAKKPTTKKATPKRNSSKKPNTGWA